MTNKLYLLLAKIKHDIQQGQFEEALKTINANRADFFALDAKATLDLHIKTLLETGSFREAIKQLEYYKNLPYVSQEVEDQMRDLEKRIYLRLEKENKKYELALKSIKKKIDSDKLSDVFVAFSLLKRSPELIHELNSEIRLALERDYGKNAIYPLINLLFPHLIGHTYEMYYFGEKIEYEVAQFYIIEDSQIYQFLMTEIEKFNKNTTIHQFAKDLALEKMIELFPMTFEESDLSHIALYLVYLVYNMIETDFDGMAFFKKHHLGTETIKKIDKKYHLGMYQG